MGGREHKIEGVGAETFVRLLRFVYGNGLYESLPSPLENRAFFEMLDTLQVTTFGRNHRLVGTGMVIERPKAMLRDDFIRLFHTANRISYTPTTTDEPPSTPTATDQQPEPTPPQPPLSELKSQQGTAKGWWSWWSWWGKQQPETNKMLLEREKQAASGSMPPGTLLNEAFLRRHGWFADLRVRCASDPPDVSASGGGEEEEDEEGEQEESETGHGAFLCHKFLLCVRSPYFQAKFEGGMSDALDKEIVIDEYERGPISQMLRFLYTDELTVNSDNAQDLLELSGHYQLERLRSVVEKFFGDNIDHDNVLSLLHLADHYQAYHLKVFCTSYVLKHQNAITSSAAWRDWRKEHPELYSKLLALLR